MNRDYINGRFERTRMLIGEEGLRILSRSRVALFGVGGVGSFAAEALARSGVGSLTLVDYDLIVPSNINRQIHALTSTLGRAKVDAMAERLMEINPNIRLKLHKTFAEKENLEALIGDGPSHAGEDAFDGGEDHLEGAAEAFEGCHGKRSDGYDYVIDAIDSVPSKIELIAYCVEKGIPLISSMGAGNKLDPTKFTVCDISKTHTCPLARSVRQQLKKRGITKGVKVVFSTERPLPAAPPEGIEIQTPGPGGKRIVPGSISFVPPVAGLIIASVVVRDLLSSVRRAEI